MDQHAFYAGLGARMGYALSQDQRQVIEADARRLQVVATAGSGKTTTLTVKIGYMISVLGIPAQSVLALSYSKASTMDFRHRFLSLFEGKAAAGVHFSTLHAFSLGIVRNYWARSERHVRLVDAKESPYQRYAHLAKVYQQVVGQFASREVLDDLFSEISYVKNALLDLASYRPKQTGFMACYEAYEAEKKRLGLMDFDDMLTTALEALNQAPDLLDALQGRFTHILIDEAQDINPIQIMLLEKLCERALQWIVIGDDDQSIYGFRAADPSFLIEFGQRHKEVLQVQLAYNYRCPEGVLAMARTHIEKNQVRLEKAILSGRGKGPQNFEAPDEATSGQVVQVAYNSLWDQVALVEGQVSKLLAAGTQPSEIALLARNHYALVAFLSRLLPLEIPIYLRDDQLGFFNHWVVRDAQLYLMVANEAFSRDHFLQLLGRLKLYLNAKGQELVRKSVNLAMALDTVIERVPDKSKAQAKTLKRCLTSHREATLGGQLHQLFKDLGFHQIMVERAARGGYGAAMPLTIWETLEGLAAQSRDYPGYLAYMKDLATRIGDLKYSKRGSGVSLMSFHGAKGLEFDHVLLVDLQKSILPSQEAIRDPQVMEEERRLYYVGMTRAKTSLYVYYPKANPSPFVTTK